jgi:hypothetical protein
MEIELVLRRGRWLPAWRAAADGAPQAALEVGDEVRGRKGAAGGVAGRSIEGGVQYTPIPLRYLASPPRPREPGAD